MMTRDAAGTRDQAAVAAGVAPGTRIESIGVHLPPSRLGSEELVPAHLRTGVPLRRASGIAERRVCRGAEDSLWLATEAARDCLARSRHEPWEIDLIVYCGITKFTAGLGRYQLEPAMAVLVRDDLGAVAARAFDVSNACAGMLTGLAVADVLIRAGTAERALIVSGEYTTHLAENARARVTDLRHPELASLTVGDAGAAAIVEADRGARPAVRRIELSTLAEHSELCMARPREDGPGGVMWTRTQEIHRRAIEAGPTLVARALAAAGLEFRDVDCVVPHQTTLGAMRTGYEVLARGLGPGGGWMVENLKRLGNTASTTHFLALHTALTEGRLDRGNRVLLLASASGLVLGVVLLEIDGLVDGYARAD